MQKLLLLILVLCIPVLVAKPVTPTAVFKIESRDGISIKKIQFTADGNNFGVLREDGFFYLFSLKSEKNKLKKEPLLSEQNIVHFGFSTNSKSIILLKRNPFKGTSAEFSLSFFKIGTKTPYLSTELNNQVLGYDIAAFYPNSEKEIVLSYLFTVASGLVLENSKTILLTAQKTSPILSSPQSISFTNDGEQMIVSYQEAGTIVQSSKLGNKKYVKKKVPFIVESPFKDCFITSNDNSIALLDRATLNEIVLYNANGTVFTNAKVTDISIKHDLNFFMPVYYNPIANNKKEFLNSFSIWDLWTGQLIGLASLEHGLKKIAAHPTRPLVATGDAKGNVLIWDISNVSQSLNATQRVADALMPILEKTLAAKKEALVKEYDASLDLWLKESLESFKSDVSRELFLKIQEIREEFQKKETNLQAKKRLLAELKQSAETLVNAKIESAKAAKQDEKISALEGSLRRYKLSVAITKVSSEKTLDAIQEIINNPPAENAKDWVIKHLAKLNILPNILALLFSFLFQRHIEKRLKKHSSWVALLFLVIVFIVSNFLEQPLHVAAILGYAASAGTGTFNNS